MTPLLVGLKVLAAENKSAKSQREASGRPPRCRMPRGTRSTKTPYRRRTAKDDEYLRAAHATTPREEIARHLGRTRTAVTQRALKRFSLRKGPSRPRGQDWSRGAEGFLRAHDGGMRTREIAVAVRRTIPAVHCRAHVLGRTWRAIRGPNRPWTKEEEASLLEGHGRLSLEQLAKRLNRTPTAISSRALSPRWGAPARQSSRRVWNPVDDTFLRSTYGRLDTKSVCRTLGGAASSTYSRAKKLGLARPTERAPRRDWSDEEDSLRRALHGKVRPGEVAIELGRTRPSLHHRAAHPGLASRVRSPEWSRRQSLPRTARPFHALQNPVGVGYVAGIVDGEGSIIGPPRFTVQMNLTTKEVIDRPWRLCGGTVTGPYEHRSGRSQICKPQYHWTVSSAENVCRLMKVLMPFLIVKKEKARDVTQFLEK